MRIRWFFFQMKDKAFNNGRIINQYHDIKNILGDFNTGWPQVEKNLSDCLSHATNHAPFYAPFKGMPLSAFPVMNKASLMRAEKQILIPQPDKMHKMSTSGSTGVPFSVLQNREKRARVLAELKVFGERAGYPSHEKMVYFQASHPVPFFAMFWTNVWQWEIASLSKQVSLDYLRRIRHGVTALFAYVSTFQTLMDHWEKEAVADMRGSGIRLVMTGAEFLPDALRARLQRFFGGRCRVVARYSNQENGVLAQEDHTPHEFTLNWGSYYFEVLKFDSDEPAQENEPGRIVITDLFNKAFPIIRYDNGDVGTLRRVPGSFPRLQHLMGRRVDLIYDSGGEPLSPHLFLNAMWGVQGIAQWQVIQNDRDQFCIRVVKGDSFQEHSLMEKLEKIKLFLGKTANLEIEYTDDIPKLYSQKRKPIVCNWNPGIRRTDAISAKEAP